MDDILVPLIVIPAIFIGMPWIIMHYITKWKQLPRITNEDEKLLDEMHVLARRLEDRLNTIERIVAADNPDFRPGLSTSAPEWKSGLISSQQSHSIDRRN
ncbi:envelope stress response membrane protein PspB [uncultured Sphingomonas sp.]|uniref:envelope stress response membrane protein PspB n=1 Tax=uncultured Sphingomonas sp. TaxID=158754 RepID=UPI0035CA3330